MSRHATLLAVSSFQVTHNMVYAGSHWYRPVLELRETTGSGAVTLDQLVFELHNGDSFVVAGPGCFIRDDSDRVPAAGTWHINAVYDLCLDLDSRTDLRDTPARVTVSYRDEGGGSGSVSATASVGQR